MCFRSPKPPPDNTLLLEQMRQREAAAERERQEQEKARQRALFEQRLAEAEQAARERANLFLGARGLQDPYYASLLDQAIADARRLVPDLDATPAAYFTDAIFENALNRERDLRRQRYLTEARGRFSDPFDLFPDDADDPYLTSILDTQRQEATDAIARAFARGDLNEVGKQRALARIGELYDAGLAQAQQIGGGVLSQKRSTLGNIRDDALRAASSYELGSTFSLDPYMQRFTTTADDLRNQLGGRIQTALSGQNFFDIGDILNTGGRAQGATNPRTTLASILERRERLQNMPRGIGGGGPF